MSLPCDGSTTVEEVSTGFSTAIDTFSSSSSERIIASSSAKEAASTDFPPIAAEVEAISDKEELRSRLTTASPKPWSSYCCQIHTRMTSSGQKTHRMTMTATRMNQHIFFAFLN